MRADDGARSPDKDRRIARVRAKRECAEVSPRAEGQLDVRYKTPPLHSAQPGGVSSCLRLSLRRGENVYFRPARILKTP